MKNRNLRLQGEAGQAGLEMLVIMLVLATLIFGALNLAGGVSLRQALDNGTAVAARRIALDPAAWHAALSGVQDGVDGAFLGGSATGPVICSVQDAAGAPVNPAALPFAAPFALTCSLPVQIRLPFVSASWQTLTARHYEIVERYP